MKKKSKKQLMWFVVLLATLNCLGGCKKNPGKIKNQDGGVNEERALRLNLLCGDVASLDPHELPISGRGCALGKWLFEGLTRLNLKGEYELAGAEKVEVSPCGTRYVFTLRTNYYSDGTLVVASDYERAWKRALTHTSKCLKSDLFYCIKGGEKAKKKQISVEDVGVKALDEKNLLVELSYPAPYILGLLSSPFFAPLKETAEGRILFNGPYMVDQWEKNTSLKLKLNPFFWDNEHMAIKRIHISMITDDTSAFYLKENGELDWAGDPLSPLPPDVLIDQIKKNALSKLAVARPFWVYINTERFPLSSPKIRQALSLLVDRHSVVEHIFKGSQPLFSPLPERFSESICSEQVNLAIAKEVFATGMKELGLTKDTFPPIVLSCCHIAEYKILSEYLQERWSRDLGIKVSLDVQDWGTFYSNLKKGSYQIGGCFVKSYYDDPLSIFDCLADANNFSRWKHARFQRVIQDAKQTVDKKIRRQLLQEAEAVAKEEAPVIPIINHFMHYSTEVKDVCFDHAGVPDFRWASF